MENTCNHSECEFAKQLFDKPEQCPFYIESWWTPATSNGKRGTPVLIKDCSNKRIFIMIQELYDRLIGVQQAQERQRDENIWVQVVAETIGKNIGVDLTSFVKERQRLQNIEKLKEIAED